MPYTNVHRFAVSAHGGAEGPLDVGGRYDGTGVDRLRRRKPPGGGPDHPSYQEDTDGAHTGRCAIEPAFESGPAGEGRPDGQSGHGVYLYSIGTTGLSPRGHTCENNDVGSAGPSVGRWPC